MIKILCVILSLILFIIPVSAETVSLYASIDDSNNTANLLTDLMRNDPSYDPYNEFAIVRSGEREYRIYFGKRLNESSTCYIYTAPNMSIPASINRMSVNSGLTINKNGYWFVGNIEGSAASSVADNYKTNYVLVIICIAIVIFLLFKLFRRQKSTGQRRYSVR